MPRLTVRPEAELDALEAASWYEGERADLGTEFLHELRTTFSRIEEGPQRFPVVFREVRRAILHRFPFGVFFIIESDSAIVLAIMHLRRHPSAWQKRT
jgi:plasmid stabilization system protein ParE